MTSAEIPDRPDMADEILPLDQSLSPEDLDLALMQRVCTGDMEAFERLVEIHQRRVVGTVAKMIGDDQDAEDISQQVFLRVWKSARKYRPSAKFTTWLFTITRNLVFNELRRRKRHPTHSIDAEESGDHSSHSVREAETKNPDQSFLQAEMQDAIQRAIDDLPEPQRLAVVLRRYEEMPYEEIAVVLNLSVSAVKSLLFRARTQLRSSLAQYLGS